VGSLNYKAEGFAGSKITSRSSNLIFIYVLMLFHNAAYYVTKKINIYNLSQVLYKYPAHVEISVAVSPLVSQCKSPPGYQ